MKWLVKVENLEFVASGKEPDKRWDKLHNHIAAMCQDGWEPWSIQTQHAFNTDYSTLTTFATIWYKRPDE